MSAFCFNCGTTTSLPLPTCLQCNANLVADPSEDDRVDQLSALQLEWPLRRSWPVAKPAVASSATVADSCGFCGAQNGKLLACGKCKVARYCNVDHQRQAWGEHKKVCGIAAAAPPTSPPPAAVPAASAGPDEQQLAMKPLDPTDPISIVRILKWRRTALVRVDEACEALCELSNDHDAIRAVLAQDGLAAVVGVAHEHMGCEALAEKVAFVLSNISVEVDLRQAVVAAGGLDVLLAIMLVHRQSADVIRTVCMALSHLASPPTLLVVAAAPGCLAQLLNALRTHMAEPAVVQAAGRALSQLLGSYVARDFVSTNGLAAQVLLKTLRTHEDDKSVCTLAMWSLAHLASLQNQRAQLRTSRALATLQAVHRRHIGQGALAFHFSVALYALTVDGEGNDDAENAAWEALARTSVEPLLVSLKEGSSTDFGGELGLRVAGVCAALAADDADSLALLRRLDAATYIEAALAKVAPDRSGSSLMKQALQVLDLLRQPNKVNLPDLTLVESPEPVQATDVTVASVGDGEKN